MNTAVVPLVGAFVFALLGAYRWSRARNLVEPAVAISITWCATVLVIVLFGDTLYGVSWHALGIFVLGLVSFSLGTALGGRIPLNVQPTTTFRYQNDRYVLLTLLFILLAGVPFYLSYVLQFTSAPLLSPRYFADVRPAMLVQTSTTVHRAAFVNNLVVLASIGAVIAYALSRHLQHHRVLAISIIILAFFYNLLTAAKTGVINLALMLFAINALQHERIPKRALTLALLAVLVLFGIVTVMRVQSGVNTTLSPLQMANVALSQLGYYLVAGPVGFSVYLKNPHLVPPVWNPWLFFERTANYFGNFFHVTNANAAFVFIGAGLNYNVYTAFFSYYPPYGPAGVAAFMLAIGLIAGLAYKLARQQHLIWQVLYAAIFYGVVMSVFAEELLLALNPILKLLLAAILVDWARRIRFRKPFRTAA